MSTVLHSTINITLSCAVFVTLTQWETHYAIDRGVRDWWCRWLVTFVNCGLYYWTLIGNPATKVNAMLCYLKPLAWLPNLGYGPAHLEPPVISETNLSRKFKSGTQLDVAKFWGHSIKIWPLRVAAGSMHGLTFVEWGAFFCITTTSCFSMSSNTAAKNSKHQACGCRPIEITLISNACGMPKLSCRLRRLRPVM